MNRCASQGADPLLSLGLIPFRMQLPSPQTLFICFGVSEAGLALFKRSRRAAKRQDRGSFALLWAVIAASMFLAIFIAVAWPVGSLGFSLWTYGLGSLLFLAGIGLRWWSIIHLGRFFTVDVAIAPDHRVVSDGPYRFVRHPSYAGALLSFLGLGILLHNWLAALVLVVPVLLAFLWRISVEEKALGAALGTAYAQYVQRTKRLVPFLY